MEDSKKVVIDTNLLVRYLTVDDPQKAGAVDNLLNRAVRGEIKVLVPSIVVAELVWVLESFYGVKAKEISELVEAIVNTPGVEVTDKGIIISTLRPYRNKNIDLIDAWITEFARERGIKTIYTFDKRHFKDMYGIEAMSP